MSTHQAPVPPHSPLNRDYELDSVPIGPSARMIRMETDPQGGLYYQFAQHRTQCLQLPAHFGSRALAVIDMVNTAALIDPPSNTLLALAAFLADGTRIVLLGRHWGQWFDDRLRMHREIDMPGVIRSWKTPLIVFDRRNLIAFDLLINVYRPDIFHPSLRVYFREGRVQHTLQLLFRYPLGAFQLARLIIHEAQSGKLIDIFDVEAFPLIWPPEQPAPAPPAARPSATPTSHAPSGETRRSTAGEPPTPPASLRSVENAPEEIQPRWGPRLPRTRPSPAVSPVPTDAPERPTAARETPRLTPLPATEHLPTAELLETLASETDLDRRWRMIEANLMMGRPERTYAIVLQFADLIAERTAAWPPARLKAAFGLQPAAVLGTLMHRWHVNQILVLADGHAEAERLTEMLREREVERLLRLDVHRQPTSAEAARSILHIDRHADTAMIKKVWRTLLGFINADYGRSEERPIHRRKDEVAKLLQAARNILLRGG